MSARLEIQAVYFSGDAMRGEFKAFAMKTWIGLSSLPAGDRIPQQRSETPSCPNFK